ncbi:MAG: 1,4-dihydroxy-2-naphthoate octaprenyltransferase, partial [Catalinimonas sp.]
SLAAGVGLLAVGVPWERPGVFWGFLGLGLASIVAAVTYTSGPRPYGYAGFGDLFVLIFFGWVGVLGTYYLHAGALRPLDALPATACGLLAVGVLNVNNLRDLRADRRAGKHSIPVRLGPRGGRIYHWALLLGAMTCAVAFVLLTRGGAGRWLVVLSFPLLLRHGLMVWSRRAPPELDPLLKQLALTTLLFVGLLGIGAVLA